MYSLLINKNDFNGSSTSDLIYSTKYMTLDIKSTCL